MSNSRDTSKEIRKLRVFSGSDQFMQNGHQIENKNRSGAGPKRLKADWASSDKKVQALLLNVFPKMASDERQRERGGIWMRVIHLYFRLGMSYGDAAAEMGVSKKKVKDVLQCINRAIRGKRCNGSRGQRRNTALHKLLGDS